MNNIHIKLDFTLPLVLTVVFIILRGLNLINWAWYWIISPIWIFAICVSIVLLVFKITEWIN